jgi:protein TonB
VPPAADQSAWRGALAAWLRAHRTYPEEARRAGTEGRVVIHFSIGPDGRVREVSLVTSSGAAMLDDAALAMLRGATLPPPPGGAAVSLTLPIRYALAP